MCLNADTGIDREAAVLVGQHVFGIKALDQTAPDEGAQDASAQGALHLGHGSFINPGGYVKNRARLAHR